MVHYNLNIASGVRKGNIIPGSHEIPHQPVSTPKTSANNKCGLTDGSECCFGTMHLNREKVALKNGWYLEEVLRT